MKQHSKYQKTISHYDEIHFKIILHFVEHIQSLINFNTKLKFGYNSKYPQSTKLFLDFLYYNIPIKTNLESDYFLIMRLLKNKSLLTVSYIFSTLIENNIKCDVYELENYINTMKPNIKFKEYYKSTHSKQVDPVLPTITKFFK